MMELTPKRLYICWTSLRCTRLVLFIPITLITSILLQPRIVNNVQVDLQVRRDQAKKWYDRGSHELSEVAPGELVKVTNSIQKWLPARRIQIIVMQGEKSWQLLQHSSWLPCNQSRAAFDRTPFQRFLAHVFLLRSMCFFAAISCYGYGPPL